MACKHKWHFATEIQSNRGTYSKWVCECGAVKEIQEFPFQEQGEGGQNE